MFVEIIWKYSRGPVFLTTLIGNPCWKSHPLVIMGIWPLELSEAAAKLALIKKHMLGGCIIALI